jgi:hypothetical protein
MRSSIQKNETQATAPERNPAMPPTSWERLTRRIAVMHRMWDAATSGLTADQMNHHERAGVLPITFSLLHYVLGEDRNVGNYLFDGDFLWESGGWKKRVGGTTPDVRRGTPVDLAETVRIDDAGAWIAYQRAIFDRTERAMRETPDDTYDRIVHDDLPAPIAGSFVGMVSDPTGPIYLGDALDGFVYQHGIRHLGEIEHGRSLLGLQGVS